MKKKVLKEEEKNKKKNLDEGKMQQHKKKKIKETEDEKPILNTVFYFSILIRVTAHCIFLHRMTGHGHD